MDGIIISSILLALRDILFAFNRFVKFVRSKFIYLFNCFSDLFLINVCVLSVKRCVVQNFTAECRMHLYRSEIIIAPILTIEVLEIVLRPSKLHWGLFRVNSIYCYKLFSITYVCPEPIISYPSDTTIV